MNAERRNSHTKGLNLERAGEGNTWSAMMTHGIKCRYAVSWDPCAHSSATEITNEEKETGKYKRITYCGL